MSGEGDSHRLECFVSFQPVMVLCGCMRKMHVPPPRHKLGHDVLAYFLPGLTLALVVEVGEYRSCVSLSVDAHSAHSCVLGGRCEDDDLKEVEQTFASLASPENQSLSCFMSHMCHILDLTRAASDRHPLLSPFRLSYQIITGQR